jgi:hypothetical protein
MAMRVFFGADGDHASMCHFADFMLELNGCVVDAEFLMQACFHVPQNAFAD